VTSASHYGDLPRANTPRKPLVRRLADVTAGLGTVVANRNFHAPAGDRCTFVWSVSSHFTDGNTRRIYRTRVYWGIRNTHYPHRLRLLFGNYHNTGLFEMTVGVLTTCHTQYTWDRSICIFLLTRTTLQVFVTHFTGPLYVHPLWFYKHQKDNRVRSKLFVACERWWFQWRFWFVPSVPGYLRAEEEHKPYPWRNPIEEITWGCI